MPLEPRVRRIVEVVRALDRRSTDATFAEQRASSAALARRGRWLVMDSGPKEVTQRDLMAPVDGGSIVVRVYVPDAPGPHPLHLFLHGGGWCVGSLHERDPRCRHIAHEARAIVASVDYRLAPENAFPTAAEDCYAALCWLVDHAAELDIDARRVSVGGESAGGNLAAVVCLMARDRSGPTISHQWLDVPATDLTMSQPSIHEVPDGHLLDLDAIHRFRAAYLPSDDLRTHPYASPLHAESHEGLPPAWIMSAEYDKLRDDGVVYAKALAEAGVPVEFQVLEGHVHPTFAFTRLVPSARDYQHQAIAALARALHT